MLYFGLILFLAMTVQSIEIGEIVDDQEMTVTCTDLERCGLRCPKGFIRYQNHCYFFSEDRLNWFDAVTVCERVVTFGPKSWISQVKSYGEKRFLRQHMNGLDAWIGGIDVLEHGDFIWYGYDDMPNKDWFGSPVPKAKSAAQCLILDKLGRIKGDNCLRRRHFVCEQKMF